MAKPTVAILGASSQRGKFGNKSVRAHLKAGYEVFPVNPTETEIEGLKAYASISDIPGAIDRVSLYLRPEVGMGQLDVIASKHPKEVWLNPGTGSPELIAKGRSLGLNMISGCSIVDVGYSPSQFPE
jgi:predicted CoA-binding protein